MTEPVNSDLYGDPQTLETSETTAGKMKEAEIGRVGTREKTSTASFPN